MAKTLFSRIFLTITAILLASCLLSTTLLYSQLGTYVVKTQSEELVDVAQHIASLTAELLNNDAATQWLYQKHIEMQGRNNRCAIIIMDLSGNVVSSAGVMDGIDKSYIDDSLTKTALGGTSVSSIMPKKSGGFYTDTFVAVEPISVDYGSGRTVWGAVAVCKPMPQIRETRNKVMSLLLTSQSIAILIAFLCSFFLSRSIARPISKLNAAAKAVATGDFTKKIEHEAGDELGELIASFNYMTDALKEIDETRSSFISNVSHELRTPMTIISGFVEGILDGTIAQDDRSKYLSIVLSETQRLSRLVTELLETSRLESGKTKLIMRPIDINELLRKGIISYENAITDKKIDVEAEFMYEQCYAVGDEDSIYRVIMNLMDNAVKFTPEGGVIRIKSAVKGSKVEVSVENTGEGISEADLAHIWERFYKTDKSRGMDKKGVGLGLYLVKTIISQHKNHIRAESKEGEYTKFTFTLDKANVKAQLRED